MAKSVKMDDVKRPDKVVPSSTSRPVLVTNRPTLKNDPMMTSDETKEGSEAESIPMNHSAKIIIPISSDIVSTEPDKITNSADVKEDDKPETEASTLTEEPSKVSDATLPESVPEPKEVTAPTIEIGSALAERDPEAALNAAEVAATEAKVKREQEVEENIASGKYTVPINAVQRRRSHITTTLLTLFAVVLAVTLLDVIADVGLVHVPSSVPRSHFFSKH